MELLKYPSLLDHLLITIFHTDRAWGLLITGALFGKGSSSKGTLQSLIHLVQDRKQSALHTESMPIQYPQGWEYKCIVCNNWEERTISSTYINIFPARYKIWNQNFTAEARSLWPFWYFILPSNLQHNHELNCQPCNCVALAQSGSRSTRHISNKLLLERPPIEEHNAITSPLSILKNW